MTIFITMIVLGFLVGFVGAGGSGFVIAVLTTIFGIPIHTALGTSLSAMAFTSLSGAYSHFRENNVAIHTGIATGLFGAVGALAGSQIASLISEDILKWLTAGMLFLSGALLWARLFTSFGKSLKNNQQSVSSARHFWIAAFGVGLVTGGLSGLLGIGAAPFIQIGLLVFLGLSAQKTAGTTMLIILPIAFMGGIGYYTSGNWDIWLFIKVASGMIIGSYIGAKFTTRLPSMVLKVAMIAVPTAAAVILLFE